MNFGFPVPGAPPQGWYYFGNPHIPTMPQPAPPPPPIPNGNDYHQRYHPYSRQLRQRPPRRYRNEYHQNPIYVNQPQQHLGYDLLPMLVETRQHQVALHIPPNMLLHPLAGHQINQALYPVYDPPAAAQGYQPTAAPQYQHAAAPQYQHAAGQGYQFPPPQQQQQQYYANVPPPPPPAYGPPVMPPFFPDLQNVCFGDPVPSNVPVPPTMDPTAANNVRELRQPNVAPAPAVNNPASTQTNNARVAQANGQSTDLGPRVASFVLRVGDGSRMPKRSKPRNQ